MSVDKVKLKALAEGMKGWDKMTECWPSDENGPDWQVGRLDEDDNRWPLLTIDTEQYDQEQDAPKVAQYYAAANPAAVLALLAENDQLKAENERLVRRDQMLAEVGCEYCGGSGHVSRIDGEYLGVCDQCPAYELSCAKHELDQLKAKLAELISAVRSINHGPAHRVVVPGDDEPQYRQRKEWIEWILELCDTAISADKKTGD